jgi:hypothetical protein
LKRLQGLRLWIDGKSPEVIEGFLVAEGDAPAMGEIRQIASRTADLLLPVAALVTTLVPEQEGTLRSLVATLIPRLELGVNAAAAQLHRLDLGLTRWQALELAKAGITSQAELERAFDEVPSRLEPLLGTVGLADLRAAFQRRYEKRGRRTPLAQEALSLFEREEF